MNVFLVSVVLAVCAVLVHSQIPQRCILPPSWVARASEIDHEFGYVNRFIMAYDEVNKRKIIVEEEHALMPGKRFYEYIILNNVNAMYTIDQSTKVCTRSTPKPWRPYGIPANATFEAEYNMGGPGESFTVTEWSDRIPFRASETWIGTYSLHNCYPVREVVFNRTSHAESISTNWYNVIVGDPDPNAFIPPAECEHAERADPPKRFHW